VGCVDRAPAGLGGFDELAGHGQPGSAGAGPLVTLVRWRTVAKVLSMVIWSPRMCVLHVEHEGLRGRDLPGGRGYLPLSITQIFRRNHACSAGAVARLVA
jgi:hypothetical protein